MRTVLLCHAHPDDETLATGAIALALAARGDRVLVLTATRGERGEVVADLDIPEESLPAVRDHELRTALAALGVSGHCYLGMPPARAVGLPSRRYLDSGMRWVTPTLAGPADDAAPEALTRADIGEVIADIAAYAQEVRATDLVSYDDDGGYGHPDHVVLHEATRAAALELGIPFHVIVTRQDQPHDTWLDASSQSEALDAALDAYRTQFRRVGDDITHVGGQPDRVVRAAGLRLG